MSLYKPQGWKLAEKVAAYSPEFTVISMTESSHFYWKYFLIN